MNAWVPLTFALNSLNRSMGLGDLYPFILSRAVIEKLGFIHDLVHGTAGHAEFRCRTRTRGLAPVPGGGPPPAQSDDRNRLSGRFRPSDAALPRADRLPQACTLQAWDAACLIVPASRSVGASPGSPARVKCTPP